MTLILSGNHHIAQYGARPDNYEITYIMHNQQPWASQSDKPCLVTYNSISPIDERKVVMRRWFQHVVHDMRHVVLLVNLFRCIQGKGRTWHCGLTRWSTARGPASSPDSPLRRQMGADYPCDDPAAKRSFNYYGSIMYGWRFRKA